MGKDLYHSSQPEEPKLIKLQKFFELKKPSKETAIEFISRIKTLGRATVYEVPTSEQIYNQGQSDSSPDC